MKSKCVLLFITLCLNLLHFGYSSDKFETIADCKYGQSLSYDKPDELTFICGETDRTLNVLNPYGVNCGDHVHDAARFGSFRKINFENCLFRAINNDYFENFTRIEEFDISGVNLKSMQIFQPPHSTLLAVFNASHNQLTIFPINLLTGFESLETLDVSYNAIEVVLKTFLVGGYNLKVLNISHNNLLEIPSSFFLPAKEVLLADFSANRIERVHHDAFSDAKNLISLDLSNNRLNLLEDHLFDNLTNLKFLNLSYNPIGDLKVGTLAYLSKLEHLDLKEASLSTIELGTFSFQTKLISLDLSENSFKWMNFGLFLPGLQQLQSLRLAGNQLQHIFRFKNALFPRLSSLDIRNNPFKCEFLQDFMESINWDGVDIPLDPNAIDIHKPNIRGVNCIKNGDLGASNEEYAVY